MTKPHPTTEHLAAGYGALGFAQSKLILLMTQSHITQREVLDVIKVLSDTTALLEDVKATLLD